jgi:hypothetical protein
MSFLRQEARREELPVGLVKSGEFMRSDTSKGGLVRVKDMPT